MAKADNKSRKEFSLECLNKDCPRKVFTIEAEQQGKDTGRMEEIVLSCPYCGTRGKYNLPECYFIKETTYRGT